MKDLTLDNPALQFLVTALNIKNEYIFVGYKKNNKLGYQCFTKSTKEQIYCLEFSTKEKGCKLFNSGG